MNLPINILSDGGGVQSSTIGAMVEAGIILPKPDAKIFANTKREPKALYQWIVEREKIIQSTIPFIEVCKGDLQEDSIKIFTSKKSGKRYMKGLIPAFTLNPDGSKGLMGRKCTPDYKIEMIVRQVRKMLGKEVFRDWRKKHKAALRQIAAYEKWLRAYKKATKQEKALMLQTAPDATAAYAECQSDALCVMWIGISTDESDRMKKSKEPWIKTRWPLIELGMSREDCKAWMLSRGYPEPPRSACTFCPFHSDDEWIRLRDESPEEFLQVVQYEKQLQEAQRNQETLKGIPFLHDSCVPIDKVNFIPTAKGRKQLSLFGQECNGLCGV